MALLGKGVGGCHAVRGCPTPCLSKGISCCLIVARADEVEIEEQVRKRSATADAMGAKTLCIPLEQPELAPGTKCFVTGKPAKNWALWGRSY